MRKRGFSLIELLLASSLLVLVMALVMVAFRYGVDAFHRANLQQGAAGEVARIVASLRRDLRRAHVRTVTVLSRDHSSGQPRDAICIGTLQDWNAVSSFDGVNGLPKWDRYVSYYATMEGKIYRSHLDPSSPDFSPVPFAPYSESYLSEDASLNPSEQTGYVLLSDQVEDFECAVNGNYVQVRIRVKGRTGRHQRVVEANLDVLAENTWPRD